VRDWEILFDKLDLIFLSNQRDTLRWILEKKGDYTTKSMYQWLNFGGVRPTIKEDLEDKNTDKCKDFSLAGHL
jgi:hypothetical protein